MSGILRRTVFLEKDTRHGNSFHRPMDMARVVTSIGTAAEPFNMFSRHSPDVNQQNVDFEDMMCRVDNIEYVDLGREKNIIGDGVHGGVLMPRAGR